MPENPQNRTLPQRAAFFVSDRTGITAEMLGHSLLTQFEGVRFREITLPFVDTIDKAQEVVRRINQQAAEDDARPVVISTLAKTEIAAVVGRANALFLDCFEMFIGRRLDRKYATLATCEYEVQRAETLMQQESIPYLDATSKSVEELAATILQAADLQRRIY